MHLNILIKYYSLSGNTKAVAEIMAENIRNKGHNVLISDVKSLEIPTDYDLLLIGTMTIGDGKLPPKVRKYLRWLIKENDFKLPKVGVYGTGDTQWTHYCRGVDELEYHLGKVTDVIGKLKIEQHPINQKGKVIKYINEIMEEFVE